VVQCSTGKGNRVFVSKEGDLAREVEGGLESSQKKKTPLAALRNTGHGNAGRGIFRGVGTPNKECEEITPPEQNRGKEMRVIFTTDLENLRTWGRLWRPVSKRPRKGVYLHRAPPVQKGESFREPVKTRQQGLITQGDSIQQGERKRERQHL